MSETFIQAWIKLPSLRDTGRFDAWLFRIAHRKCLDELRKARPEPLSATYDRIDAAPDRTPDGFVERAADQQFMRRAMQQLSDEQREVVVLRFLYELPHDEVARIMGKNAAAVRALQYRALGRLRKYLRQPDSGAGASVGLREYDGCHAQIDGTPIPGEDVIHDLRGHDVGPNAHHC